jgi:hypothetical protein
VGLGRLSYNGEFKIHLKGSVQIQWVVTLHQYWPRLSDSSREYENIDSVCVGGVVF